MSKKKQTLSIVQSAIEGRIDVNDATIQILSLDDVKKKFLAIGTSPSGKSFRYKDEAVDLKSFVDYVSSCYPNLEIECVVNLG